MLLVTGQIDSGYLGKAKGFLHEAEQQRLMLSSLCRRVETVRRTEDIGRAVIAAAEDIRAGRPQPGAVEIPIDQQYRRAEVVMPESPQRTPPTSPTPDALAKVAEALVGRDPAGAVGRRRRRQLGRRPRAGGAGRAPRRPGRHHRSRAAARSPRTTRCAWAR